MLRIIPFIETDSALLDRIRSGDESALVQILKANSRSIHSFILKNSGTADDADDILQEAVVILWEKIHAGTFEQTAKLSTFIYATARNLWFRRLARHRKEIRQDTDFSGTPDGEPSALDTMIISEDAHRVQQAMERLGNPCRELLLLYYWQELSMEQIAEKMGYAGADTVKAKKYQCKKALERLL